MDTVTDTTDDSHRPKPRNGKGRWIRDLECLDRDRQAAAAVTQGMTYEEVAEAYGYTDKGACWRAVRKVRHEAAQLTGTSEDIRRAQLAEIAEQRGRLWETINDPPPLTDRVGRIIRRPDGTEVPNDAAVQNAHALLIQLSKREGAIRGTDAPRRSVTATATLSAAELADLFEAIAPQDFTAAVTEFRRRVEAKQQQQQLEARTVNGYAEP